jgi:diaminohydroxyphosphoribosylaminopyrimidine deaminase/5-amino-6-(5-phosphoribosylamino)uracil reductase
MTGTWQGAMELDGRRVANVLARTRRPYISLKAAVTLDGKIAGRQGESRWITGEAARAAGRALRARHAGVLVGINTVLADDPQLTVRGAAPGPDPARIVLDSLGRIPLGARCLRDDGARRIVVGGTGFPPAHAAALEQRGVWVLRCSPERPDPDQFLPRLRAAGIETLLVEGGAHVHASLIAHHAADALFLFVAGKVMGDAAAPAWCAALPGGNRLQDAPALTFAPPLMIGPDVLLRGHFPPP